MNRVARTMIALAAAMIASAAPAQTGTDGEMFVDKVRDGDNQAALDLLEATPTILDYQDARGDTALLVALRRRDMDWAAHLLRAGANPNLASRSGDTPLVAAARSGFADAVGWLLGAGAKVDGINKKGETALIVAIQRRDLSLVRFLLANGADPDRQDATAGYSARDYAKRDTRAPELLAAIESSKAVRTSSKPAPSGKLEDFKLD